jgi:hypothetical protein
MLTMLFSNIVSYFSSALPTGIVLLAQAGDGSGPSPPIQWAIVLFAVLLGLFITVSPSRRTYEVKRPKDE